MKHVMTSVYRKAGGSDCPVSSCTRVQLLLRSQGSGTLAVASDRTINWLIQPHCMHLFDTYVDTYYPT